MVKKVSTVMLGKMEAFQMVILKRKLSTAMQNQAHDY